MSDMAASMASIIFGALIIIVLLRVLMLVRRQNKKVEELKTQLELKEQARKEKEKI